MSELEALRGFPGAPARLPPRPRPGPEAQVPLLPGPPPWRPRTFMRSRFLDNFVLRSAAMLAPARSRAPLPAPAAHAHCCVRPGVVSRSSRRPAPLATPVSRAFARPGISARRCSARLTEELGVRTRPPTQGRLDVGRETSKDASVGGGPSSGPWERPVASVVARRRPGGAAETSGCSPHCPGWTASVTRFHRGRRASRAPHHGPRNRSSDAEDTDAGEGRSAGLGVGGRGRVRTQAVRAPEMRRKALLESPFASVRERAVERPGRTHRRRTGGHASQRTRRTGASVLRGPPEDEVPTVRRKAPGRTPHACSWRRLPRLRGFTYTCLQLGTPCCCHRVLGTLRPREGG